MQSADLAELSGDAAGGSYDEFDGDPSDINRNGHKTADVGGGNTHVGGLGSGYHADWRFQGTGRVKTAVSFITQRIRVKCACSRKLGYKGEKYATSFGEKQKSGGDHKTSGLRDCLFLSLDRNRVWKL